MQTLLLPAAVSTAAVGPPRRALSFNLATNVVSSRNPSIKIPQLFSSHAVLLNRGSNLSNSNTKLASSPVSPAFTSSDDEKAKLAQVLSLSLLCSFPCLDTAMMWELKRNCFFKIILLID